MGRTGTTVKASFQVTRGVGAQLDTEEKAPNETV